MRSVGVVHVYSARFHVRNPRGPERNRALTPWLQCPRQLRRLTPGRRQAPTSSSRIPTRDGPPCFAIWSSSAATTSSSRATATKPKPCFAGASSQCWSSRTSRCRDSTGSRCWPSCGGYRVPPGPPVIVVSSSKELSGAAWNLKERLGVTELLSADAGETEAQDTLSRVLPALGPAPPTQPRRPPSRTSAGSARRSTATCPMSRADFPWGSCWSRWSSASTSGFACT